MLPALAGLIGRAGLVIPFLACISDRFQRRRHRPHFRRVPGLTAVGSSQAGLVRRFGAGANGGGSELLSVLSSPSCVLHRLEVRWWRSGWRAAT
jgi:hypothetical protein